MPTVQHDTAWALRNALYLEGGSRSTCGISLASVSGCSSGSVQQRCGFSLENPAIISLRGRGH